MTAQHTVGNTGEPGTSFPIRFRGHAACRRDGAGPLGLILTGETEGRSGEPLQLGFAAAAPGDLPDSLESARVEQLATHRYRIASGDREWVIEGVVHIHRDVGRPFSLALPGRPVPWHKRIFWRALLALAAHKLTRSLLLRSSG